MGIIWGGRMRFKNIAALSLAQLFVSTAFLTSSRADEKAVVAPFRNQAKAAVTGAQSQIPSGLPAATQDVLNNYFSTQIKAAENLCSELLGLKLKEAEIKTSCSNVVEKFALKLASKVADMKAGTGTDQILDELNLKIAPNDSNSMAVPDNQNEWIGASFVPIENPPPAYLAAKSHNEKARAYHAEMLERKVRVYVAGSKQLFVDKGVKHGDGTVIVRGLYQGFTPDLVNSTKEIQVAGAYRPEWGDCTLGVANEQNDAMKWFKFPSGNYEKERFENGKLFSHTCNGKPNSSMGTSGQDPLIRGKIVNALMLFMRKMQTDMTTQGKFVTAPGYGIQEPPSCTKIAAEINAMRTQLRKIRNDITQGMEKDQHANALSCVATQNAANVKLDEKTKTLSGGTARGCVYDSMQTLTENKHIGMYAYCTWSTVASEIMARVKSSQIGKHRHVTADELFAKLPLENTLKGLSL